MFSLTRATSEGQKFNILNLFRSTESKASNIYQKVEEANLTTSYQAWQRVMERLPEPRTSNLNTQIFPTLIALNCLSMNLSANEFQAVTGCEDTERLFDAISGKRIPLCVIDEGKIRFVTSVSDELDFLAGTGKGITDYVAAFAADPNLAPESIVSIDKIILSLRRLFNPEKSCGADFQTILDAFSGTTRNIDVLVDKERIHSLELALLYTKVLALDVNADDYEDRVDELYTESFVHLCDLIPADSVTYRGVAWIKYINAASNNTGSIPRGLLDFVDIDTYKQCVGLLKDHVKKFKYSNADQQHQDRYWAYTEAIGNKILNEIDEDCVPASLLMAKLHAARGEYEAARSLYQGTLYSDGDYVFPAMLSILCTYENEVSDLLMKKNAEEDYQKAEYYKARIRSLNNTVAGLYAKYEAMVEKRLLTASEEEYEEIESQRVTLATKHARLLKKQSRYKECFQVLQSVADAENKRFRVYAELGFLHQVRGSKRMPNQYYDLEKAIQAFKDAYEDLMTNEVDMATKTTKKSLLIPLANTFYMAKRFDEAKAVCEDILDIDRRERKAYEMLAKIDARVLAA